MQYRASIVFGSTAVGFDVMDQRRFVESNERASVALVTLVSRAMDRSRMLRKFDGQACDKGAMVTLVVLAACQLAFDDALSAAMRFVAIYVTFPMGFVMCGKVTRFALETRADAVKAGGGGTANAALFRLQLIDGERWIMTCVDVSVDLLRAQVIM